MERYEAAVRLMPHSIRDWLNQLLVALHLRDPPAKPQDFPYLESILAFAGPARQYFGWLQTLRNLLASNCCHCSVQLSA